MFFATTFLRFCYNSITFLLYDLRRGLPASLRRGRICYVSPTFLLHGLRRGFRRNLRRGSICFSISGPNRFLLQYSKSGTYIAKAGLSVVKTRFRWTRVSTRTRGIRSFYPGGSVALSVRLFVWHPPKLLEKLVSTSYIL
jgi:hypothetical protein